MREFGFSAAELDRAKQWMAAFYERAYNERDKTESGSFAQEYLSYFLEGEPSPGIAYEYRLVQQLLPDASRPPRSRRWRGRCSATTAAWCSPRRRRRPASACRPRPSCRRRWRRPNAVAVTPWNDTTVDARADRDASPAPAAVTSRREVADVGVTVVRFANGVEAWLKPTDFKNDQVLFTLDAPGGASLAPPRRLSPRRRSRRRYVGLSGVGGLKALDLQKLLAGKLASALAVHRRCRRTASPAARAPAQLETALQLLYQDFTAPGDDPEAFALLKRQLDGGGRQPRTVAAAGLRREARAGQHVEPLHVAAADARARRRRSTARR